MKKIILVVYLIIMSSYSYSQKLNLIADSLLKEGLKIYKLEKAAWISSDKLAEKPVNSFLTNGYIPFYDNDSIKTLFYYHDSFDTKIKFIGSISIHDSLKTTNVHLNSIDRNPTDKELLIIKLRNEISEMIELSPSLSEYSDLFSYNISLLENDSLLQFYLLPGTTRNDMFYLGSDYIINFSLNGKLLGIKAQHNNLIEMKPPSDVTIEASLHSHINGTSEFITATDICQAKLYGKLTNNCTVYRVISESYESTYNIESDSLIIHRR